VLGKHPARGGRAGWFGVLVTHRPHEVLERPDHPLTNWVPTGLVMLWWQGRRQKS